MLNYRFLNNEEEKKYGENYGDVCVGISLLKTRENLSFLVSIKKLKKRHDDKHRNLLIENEARIVKRLTHPNIVQYLEVAETHDCNYIVMERLPLGNMYDCNAVTDYTKFEVGSIVNQILSALHYLHKTCKIVHRDIKLANILLTWSPNYLPIVKLCDFGISYCENDDPNHIRNLFYGTRPYMAPEIMQFLPHSYPVDMWGLGVCMYQLFTKTDPFCLPEQGNISYSPQLMTYVVPENLTKFEKVFLQSLLCLDPSDRVSATVALMLCKECMEYAREFDEPSRKRLRIQGCL